MDTPFDNIKASTKLKNYIDINPENNPYKYRIFHEMSKHDKYILEDVRESIWWKKVSKQIGLDLKKLNAKQKLVYPPITNRNHNFAIIATRNNVKVIEQPLKNKIKRFIFTHL